MGNFNTTHPERREGEVWIMNVDNKGYVALDSRQYRTARRGETAYRPDGSVVTGWYPVFVQADEYNEKNANN